MSTPQVAAPDRAEELVDSAWLDRLTLDSTRFCWLTEDHANPEERAVCRSILERMPVMSYAAACDAIDSALGRFFNSSEPAAPIQVSPTTTLTGQILVMATLLEKALRVVKNVEAEGSDEGEHLQALIDQGEAAIATVLTEHAMPQTALLSADPPDHHPV